MTTGFALLGCGLVGAKRADALPPDCRLVTAFDVEPAHADALADRLGGRTEVARSVDDALAHAEVDAVIVATPHRELPALAIAAIDAGHHVLVEKPAAPDVAGARTIAARAAAGGRVAHVGFNHRFHPALLEARRIVGSGAYGAVMHVRARYGHGGRLGYEREWRAQREVSGGGELIDQGIHLVDLTRFLVGDVELAFSELRTSFWPMEVEDNAFLALRARAARSPGSTRRGRSGRTCSRSR